MLKYLKRRIKRLEQNAKPQVNWQEFFEVNKRISRRGRATIDHILAEKGLIPFSQVPELKDDPQQRKKDEHIFRDFLKARGLYYEKENVREQLLEKLNRIAKRMERSDS